ncbi:MAG TPA: sulfatase [Chitinophagaceae bacterium]|nr:sulfatase [Chitinophagaceae bacterium]
MINIKALISKWFSILFLLLYIQQASAQTNKKYNVLFIAVDDLNDWVGPLDGYKGVKTPNIDKLAKEGMNFTRAYCPAPVCNPSRAALLTGVRPSTSGVYQNWHPWRRAMPNVVTLPQYFMANGYEVVGISKIFHDAYNDSASWHKYFPQLRQLTPEKNPVNGFGNFDWGPLQAKDEDMADYTHVQHGIDFLNEKHDKPFFLAVGIKRPHLSWWVPQKYFDLYPLSTVVIPKVIPNDLSDVPPIGVTMAKRIPEGQQNAATQNMEDHKFIIEKAQWKQAIQGYLASITFADAMFGRLLDALNRSPYKQNTIIIFFGDHGWHLGEKEHWRKFALWEEATRVPFIIVAPGVAKPNSVCERTVNLMDIYPTLISLCSLPEKEGLEAMNIMPLLKNPELSWDHPSITTFGYGNHAVRTERWRYIQYSDKTEELYDHNADPSEWKNLASDPKYTDTKNKLSAWLPKVNAKASPPDSSIRRGRPQNVQDSTSIRD